jgi:hypothetical protein
MRRAGHDALVAERPLLDLAARTARCAPNSTPPGNGSLDSGQFVLGPEVEAFEQPRRPRTWGSRHAVGLNSGTDALTIALRALGVGPGDEVITTPFSFFATSETVLLLGRGAGVRRPGARGFLLDPEAVAAAVTAHARDPAGAPVRRVGTDGGAGADRERHDLRVIEDAAQAFGARCLRLTACRRAGAACGDARGRAAGALGRRRGLLVLPDQEPRRARRRRAADDRRRRRRRTTPASCATTAANAATTTRSPATTRASTRSRPPAAGQAAAPRRVDRGAPAGRGALRRACSPTSTGRHAPAPDPGHVYHQYTVRLAPACATRWPTAAGRAASHRWSTTPTPSSATAAACTAICPTPAARPPRCCRCRSTRRCRGGAGPACERRAPQAGGPRHSARARHRRGPDDDARLTPSAPRAVRARTRSAAPVVRFASPVGTARWRPPNQVRSEEAALRGDRQVPRTSGGALLSRLAVASRATRRRQPGTRPRSCPAPARTPRRRPSRDRAPRARARPRGAVASRNSRTFGRSP